MEWFKIATVILGAVYTLIQNKIRMTDKDKQRADLLDKVCDSTLDYLTFELGYNIFTDINLITDYLFNTLKGYTKNTDVINRVISTHIVNKRKEIDSESKTTRERNTSKD